MTNNDILKDQMVAALEKTLGIVTKACEMVGISRETHYRWLRTDEVYKEKVESVGDIALDFAESELFKQIKEGNITGVIFFLKTKGKKRGYIERSEFDHTTKGEKINVSINIAGDDLNSDDIE
jgi:hypothetical protein